MARRSPSTRVEFGDWQTPAALADQVVALLVRQGAPAPGTVIEPTCGEGSFLLAARRQWPSAQLRGFDVNPHHVEAARSALSGDPLAVVAVSDFFSTPWEAVVRASPGPILILGNPPWVTSAELGGLQSTNLPRKGNFKGLKGLDAITGRGNFDVSEWMLLRLLAACANEPCTIAVLCKAAVARRVMERCAVDQQDVDGSLWGIDTKRHFDASVEAALLVMKTRPGRRATLDLAWPVFADLTSVVASGRIGVVGGVVTSDVDGFQTSRAPTSGAGPGWRSGLKHDCSRVMELTVRGGDLVNGDGETVDIEPDLVFPLLKGSDVANGRLDAKRRVIVPQRALGQDTDYIARDFPKTWAYLARHSEALRSRKSSIYERQPQFSVFGVGDYTFAPWKIAICGLYKRLTFQLIGPQDGRPVVFDDTCYFLPFQAEPEARRAFESLTSADATRALESRIFWDNKRPINKAVLQSFSLSDPEGATPRPAPTPQLTLGWTAK
jgi:hypothetical protein